MATTLRRRAKVELFLGPIAATCAGGPTPAKQEKITKAFALRTELEKRHSDRFEVVTWDLGKDEEYDEGLRHLGRYLLEAGEDEAAEANAFAINVTTPSVAVQGELVWIGDCPTVDELIEWAGFLEDKTDAEG
jgi:hypothetical protein